MTKMTKTQLDAMVRAEGLNRVNLEGLTAVTNNTFIGTTEVDGVKRFYEIKVVAKSTEYTDETLEETLKERAAVEARKIETKNKAAEKRIRDEKKRAEKAAKDAEKKAEAKSAQ